MIWILLGFLSAFSQAGRAIFSKKILKDTDEYIAAFANRLLTSIILLPLLFFINIPQLGKEFWIVLIISAIFLGFNTILYMKAVKLTDVSLIMPLYSLVPLFVLISSPFIIKEIPSIYGFIGILLIVIGSYVLNIHKNQHGYLTPFKNLLTHNGVRIMLLVCIIWALNSNLDRMGLTYSSALFWLVSTNILMTIILLPITIYKAGDKLKQIPKKLSRLLPISICSACEVGFYMVAIQFTLLVYVISVKRFSILIGVLLGCLIFKEKNIQQRMIGAIIMLAGIIIIALFN